ncbi:MAG: hypothetical protein GKC03_08345 [Methanomassiliicoccales archaeon]|nr:hypothetical protein [Methanomassiliicoccales archaeon]
MTTEVDRVAPDYYNLILDLGILDIYLFPIYISFIPIMQRDTTLSPFMDVIVESRIYSDIDDELDRYADDVEKTGLGVRIFTVATGTSPDTIRSHLSTAWASGLQGCFMVGNITAAWFEMESQWDPSPAPPKHEEFPCDLFYMDLDGYWEDNDTDGMYNIHTAGSGDIEADIWLGRIRADLMSGDEITLLTDYFDKNHDFRIGDISYDQEALVYVDDDWTPANDVYDRVGYAISSRTHVTDKATTCEANYLDHLDDGYTIVHVMCHGSPTGHRFKVPDTNNPAVSIWEPGARVDAVPDVQGWDETDSPNMFYNLFVCSGGRFTSEDYLAGWQVLNPSTTLIALASTKTGSMFNEGPFYTPIGNGDTVGEAFGDWFASTAEVDRKWVYGMSLTGDPTLRMTGKHAVNIDVSGLAPAGLTTVTYTEGGTAKSINVGNGITSIDCDHGTSLSIDPTVPGSMYTTDDQVNFIVVEPIIDLEVQYYQQHQVTINTNGMPMIPGASVSYTQNGVLKSKLIWDGAGFSELCDAGTTVQIEDVVVVSSTERYHTTDTTSWTVNGDITATVDYIHQYWINCGVDTVGYTDLNVANHVNLDYELDEASLSYDLYDAVSLSTWMDENSYYTFSNPSTASDASHRWFTPDTTSYQVTGSATTILDYWEQYKCSVQATGMCLSSLHPGEVNYEQFGTAQTGYYCDASPWQDWCDIGSTITMSEIVLIDSDMRCHTNDQTSYTVLAATTYVLDYHLEFKITLAAEGLPDSTSTEVTIGTANPSWPDSVSGGDIDDYVVVLSSANDFSWTNWTHYETTLTATELIEIDQSEKYILVCWTVNYTVLTIYAAPPTVQVFFEGALYTAHYMGVKKNIWEDEAELAQPVMVSIEISTTWAIDNLETLNLTDDLPNEFSFVMHSATRNGSPIEPTVNEVMTPPPHQQLVFDLGTGDQNITYEVRINRAHAVDTTVSNSVLVEVKLPCFPAISLGVSDDLMILVYEGATLSKTADGPDVVIVNTNNSWEFTFIVKNNFDYDMVDAILKDHFGAELDYIADSVMANLLTEYDISYSKGTMKQVRMEWSLDQIVEGEAFMLQMTVYTKLNPAGKQEYTSPGTYDLNSGATLKWYDERGKKHSLETGTIQVVAVKPEII